MNCLETRRALLSNPRANSAELSKHLGDCVHCTHFANRQMQLESVLRAAIEVPTPNQLEERVLLNRQLRGGRRGFFAYFSALRNSTRIKLRTIIPLAASLVLAVAVWMAIGERSDTVDWSRVALLHVIDEASALSSSDTLPQERLDAVLKAHGLKMKAPFGALRYVDLCEMPGGRGVHAVIETQDLGKITLILPPVGVSADQGVSADRGFIAQVIHVDKTSVGIVSQNSQNQQLIVARLRSQLVSRV